MVSEYNVWLQIFICMRSLYLCPGKPFTHIVHLQSTGHKNKSCWYILGTCYRWQFKSYMDIWNMVGFSKYLYDRISSRVTEIWLFCFADGTGEIFPLVRWGCWTCIAQESSSARETSKGSSQRHWFLGWIWVLKSDLWEVVIWDEDFGDRAVVIHAWET